MPKKAPPGITRRTDAHGRTFYRARFREGGRGSKEHAKNHDTLDEAIRWLVKQKAALSEGTYTPVEAEKMTVGEWADIWLVGYETRRASTVRQARTHIKRIKAQFGTRPMVGPGALRPSDVKSWMAALDREGLQQSTRFALHARLAQLFNDAVDDGLVQRSPCSRKTSPGQGKAKCYVATTDQIWSLYEAFPENLRPAVLLGAFAGLRPAETCGLRVEDVDFLRKIVHPRVQYPAEPLKTPSSDAPVPVAEEVTAALAAALAGQPDRPWVLANQWGKQVAPWTLERAMREARATVPRLPEQFGCHDLRHYYASLLIEQGLSIKVVQARLRHQSAKVTLDTYGHLFPDSDEPTRAVISAAFAARKPVAL